MLTGIKGKVGKGSDGLGEFIYLTCVLYLCNAFLRPLTISAVVVCVGWWWCFGVGEGGGV